MIFLSSILLLCTQWESWAREPREIREPKPPRCFHNKVSECKRAAEENMNLVQNQWQENEVAIQRINASISAARDRLGKLEVEIEKSGLAVRTLNYLLAPPQNWRNNFIGELPVRWLSLGRLGNVPEPVGVKTGKLRPMIQTEKESHELRRSRLTSERMLQHQRTLSLEAIMSGIIARKRLLEQEIAAQGQEVSHRCQERHCPEIL
jgi:hypothetical protein